MTKTYFLFAVLFAAAVGSTAADAGMSGMSDRIQEQSLKESRATIAPQAAQPTRALHPAAKAAPAPVRQQPSVTEFDGPWAVSQDGCGLAPRTMMRVSRGRVIGEGVTGSIDASGNVRTRGAGGGLTTTGRGKVSSSAGSGTYTVSNGCVGTWTARKV